MKYAFTLLLTLISCYAIGQRQFSVVCNQNTMQAEVIVTGSEQPHHTLIKDQFPNQRVAQQYISDNQGTINCGGKPQSNQPPPTTAGNRPTNTSAAPTTTASTGSSSNSPGSTVRMGRKVYNRNFTIRGGINRMFSLDQIYPGNVDNTTQTLGYAVGVDLSFGRHVKGGLGLYYTSLFGSFQEILLDANRFNAAFYGAISGPKGEAFIRVPTRIGTNSWFLFDFGFGVYFNAKNNIIEQFTDQVRPSINKEFYGMRWGLGADIKRVLIMLNGEIVAGISDDIDKTQFFQIGLTTGYAF